MMAKQPSVRISEVSEVSDIPVWSLTPPSASSAFHRHGLHLFERIELVSDRPHWNITDFTDLTDGGNGQ